MKLNRTLAVLGLSSFLVFSCQPTETKDGGTDSTVMSGDSTETSKDSIALNSFTVSAAEVQKILVNGYQKLIVQTMSSDPGNFFGKEQGLIIYATKNSASRNDTGSYIIATAGSTVNISRKALSIANIEFAKVQIDNAISGGATTLTFTPVLYEAGKLTYLNYIVYGDGKTDTNDSVPAMRNFSGPGGAGNPSPPAPSI